MTTSNSSLRFKIDFYNYAPKKFVFTDVFDTAGWNAELTIAPSILTSTEVKGIVKAVNPAGTVFYGGTAYNTNDFTAPDIDGSTADWVSSAITLPTTLTCGNYTFYYKTQVKIGYGTAGGTTYGTFTGVTAGVFAISTLNFQNVFGTNPTGLKLQVTSSTAGHVGVWDVTSIADVAGDTTITCTSAAAKTYVAAATDEIFIILETSKSYNYCATTPTQEVTKLTSCVNSQVTLLDASDYTITNSGLNLTYSPTSTSRSWTVTYPGSPAVQTPITATVNPVIFGAGTSYNSGANIWTGVYSVQMTALNVYNMEAWTYGGAYYWFVLHTSTSYSGTHTVECSTCLCNIYDCLQNIATRYAEAVANGSQTQTTLANLQAKISYAIAMYGLAEKCGEDTSYWCNLLNTYASDFNCQCPTSGTGAVEEVIPLGMGSGSYTPVGITFGVVADGYPASPNANDIHIFTNGGSIGGVTITAGDCYQYILGVWQYQYTLGGGGGAGSFYNVVISDITDDTSALGGWQTLKTEVFDGDTCASSGSCFDIEAYVQINTGTEASLRLYLGSTVILEELNIVASATTYLRLFCRVTRTTSAANQIYEGCVTYVATPSASVYRTILTATEDLHTNKNIMVQKNVVSGTETDVVCKYLRVTIFNKA